MIWTDFDEAYDLLCALLNMPESRLYALQNGVVPLTLTDQLLMKVHNAVIASIPTEKSKQGQKKKAMIYPPQPKEKRENQVGMTMEQARQFYSNRKVRDA